MSIAMVLGWMARCTEYVRNFIAEVFMTPKIRYISRICQWTSKLRYIATICRGDEKWVSARAKNSFQIVSNMKEF